jgi:4-amino-4-deoxy-L-arabinose transferase
MTSSRIALLCCVLLAPLWLMTMFDRGLWTPDEPREADISQNMLVQQHRAVPTLAGRPFLEKPPLAYWISAGAAKLWPERAAALRAPNLLYACLVTLAVVALASSAGPIAAWVAGLASGTFLLSLQVASWLATDAAMMVGVTAALLGFYRGLEAPRGRAKLAWYALMHAALAWAFLAKGPGAWLVPSIAAAGVIAMERNWRELVRWELWVPLTIPLAVVAAWLWAVSRGPDGTHELAVLLWYNVAGRAIALHAPDAAAYAEGHTNWPGKYLVQLPLYVAPWSFLFVAAIRRAWSDMRGPNGRLWRLAVCACILPLLVLSFAATARGIYAAPALPAAALLIGLWFSEHRAALDRFERAMLLATYVLVAALAVVLVAASVLAVTAEPAARSRVLFSAISALVAAVAFVFAFRSLRSGTWPSYLATTWAGFVLTVLAACSLLFPDIDRLQDYASIVRRIDADSAARDLDLYQPDETTVAVVDLYAARHRGRWHIFESGAPRTVSDGAADSRAILVRLPGVGAGPLGRALQGFGVKTTSSSGARAIDVLARANGLHIERSYDMPDGRRYALLAATESASGASRGVLAAKSP